MSERQIVRLLALVVCAVLPAIALLILFVEAVREDVVAFDFRVFYSAAQAVVDGNSPYPDPGGETTRIWRSYVYPPLTALAVVPLTQLPVEAAGILVMAALVVAVLAVPYVLGVRDWRCYGVALLWPPVISAIQTGSVTILLALCAALTWRFRERRVVSSAALAFALAMKLLLWPLVVWFASVRRAGTAALGVTLGAVLVIGSWAAIGFDGFLGYPELLRRLEHAVGLDSYTLYVVSLDLGAPSAVARGIWVALGVCLLAGTVILGRRGDERSAFVLAIAAALALSPLVWLHYFTLLLVVVALTRPTLGFIWFAPLLMLVSPGSGNPSLFETVVVLAVSATIVGLSLGRSEDELDPVGQEPTVAPEKAR